MSLETGLYTAITSDGTVAALVSTRVYPEFMPQGVTYPAITYQRVSTVRTQLLSGIDNFTQVRVVVDCWDSSYSGAKALADAVKNALDGVTVLGAQSIQHCYMDSMSDLSEIDGDREDRRVSLQFIIFLDE
jgi:hypothetical protein